MLFIELFILMGAPSLCYYPYSLWHAGAYSFTLCEDKFVPVT